MQSNNSKWEFDLVYSVKVFTLRESYLARQKSEIINAHLYYKEDYNSPIQFFFAFCKMHNVKRSQWKSMNSRV